MSTASNIAGVIAQVLDAECSRRASPLRLIDNGALKQFGASAYEVCLSGVQSEVKEMIVLCRRWHPELNDTIRKVLSSHVETSQRATIIVVEESFVGDSCNGALPRLSYDAFFEALCDVPSNLWDVTFSKARRDTNGEEYKFRYQDRQLRILSRPDGGEDNVVDANEYLLRWACAEKLRHPLILLGERGSGKTWQVFKLCQRILEAHKQNHWLYGPAFFVDLRLLDQFSSSSRITVPHFSEAMHAEYPSVRYRWGDGLARSFLTAGHTILCLDGFEEAPSVAYGDEAAISDFIRLVCTSLPIQSRFLLACRGTNFGSLERLLEMEAWPGTTVRSAFEVVSLDPFPVRSVSAYLTALPAKQQSIQAVSALIGHLSADASATASTGLQAQSAAWGAVAVCTRYPALLAAMVNHAATCERGLSSPSGLLYAALVDSVIGYNVEMGKAARLYVRKSGELIHLGKSERVEFLGDLVWHLATRGYDTVDMAAIPQRLARFFGLDLDAARNNVRIHSVLELIPDLQSSSSNVFRLAVRPQKAEHAEFFPQVQDGRERRDSVETVSSPMTPGSRVAELSQQALDVAPIGVTSASGAFFLATHIASRLAHYAHVPIPQRDKGSLLPVDRLRPLGAVPLGVPAAEILAELLDKDHAWQHGVMKSNVRGTNGLVEAVVRAIAECAARADLSVFCSSLRFIGHNLEAMGLIDRERRTLIDPWMEPSVANIVRSPAGLPQYQMVLIPSPHSSAMPALASDAHPIDPPPDSGGPYLIGVREVTNSDYLDFLNSDQGALWRAEQMISAGSEGLKKPTSKYARHANEYYLYFWGPGESAKQPHYRPTPESYSHPVAYVSWFAAGAFCDWLSESESEYVKMYKNYIDGDEARCRSENRHAYRLPSILEWSWAARCGQLNVRYPWELFPLVLSDADLKKWAEQTHKHNKEEALVAVTWFQAMRRSYRESLLGLAKEHIPVLSDPISPLGTSGMMGNVKEWCHDALGGTEARTKRAILGSTGYLGESSFAFDYAVSLFPENTNPDVGFRICRSLSQHERNELANREKVLAKLST